MSDKDTMTLEEIEMSKRTKNKNRMELDEIIGSGCIWQHLTQE
jgi:hypothetical protein